MKNRSRRRSSWKGTGNGSVGVPETLRVLGGRGGGGSGVRRRSHSALEADWEEAALNAEPQTKRIYEESFPNFDALVRDSVVTFRLRHDRVVGLVAQL